MQCQLLVIILMMMKAVKILIHNLIGILYHFFVRSNYRLLITFFLKYVELVKNILTVLLEVFEISN